MRQLLYVSKGADPLDAAMLDAILERSRRNNALDGVTGLLWSDGRRFAQVIEGDPRAIADTIARIQADPRHRDLVVLDDRVIEERQFGDWSMELRAPCASADEHDARMHRALQGASDAIREAFGDLVAPVAA